MNKSIGFTIGIVSILVLIVIITLIGVFSFKPFNGVLVPNQYGDTVQIFGTGIYARDSYFKAPILIGSDLTMLVFVAPLLLFVFIRDRANRTIKSQLLLVGVLSTICYYATSIAFGVTYNIFFVLYIALFSASLFTLFAVIRSIDMKLLQKSFQTEILTRGLKIFLIISGISLFVAWLPDIMQSAIQGKPLALLEVYTTEITYVLDMGIISPIIFACLLLLKRRDGLGYILLSAILMTCTVIGAMLPIQTLFQTLAGISIPLPVLAVKVGIFVVLAFIAIYFNLKIYKQIMIND
jgi:hypothetical protein